MTSVDKYEEFRQTINAFIDPDIKHSVRTFQTNAFRRYASDLGFTYASFMRHLNYVRLNGYMPFFVGDVLDTDLHECEMNYWEDRDYTDYEIVYAWKSDILTAVKLLPGEITSNIITRGMSLLPSRSACVDKLDLIITGIPIVTLPTSNAGGSFHLSTKDLPFPHIRMHYAFNAAIRDLAHIVVEGLCEGINKDNMAIFSLGVYSSEFLARIRKQLDFLKEQWLVKKFAGDLPLSRRPLKNDLGRYLHSVGSGISLGARSFLYLHELGHFIYGHHPSRRYDDLQEEQADSFAIHILHGTKVEMRFKMMMSIEFVILALMYVNNDNGMYDLKTRLNIIHAFKKYMSLNRALVEDVFLVPIIKILCEDNILDDSYYNNIVTECDLAASGEFASIPYDMKLRRKAEALAQANGSSE